MFLDFMKFLASLQLILLEFTKKVVVKTFPLYIGCNSCQFKVTILIIGMWPQFKYQLSLRKTKIGFYNNDQCFQPPLPYACHGPLTSVVNTHSLLSCISLVWRWIWSFKVLVSGGVNVHNTYQKGGQIKGRKNENIDF